MANVSIYAAFERMWQHFIAKLSSKADVDSIPTSTSQLENDSGFLTAVPDEYVTNDELTAKGYLTSYTETDPTVPDWAKASTKPSYTADEVGAAEAEHTHDDYALKTDILSLDTTLSVEGAAADAKAVGDALANISGGNADYGAENAGKLLYVNTDGTATVLALGAGLAIVDGVLTITSAQVTAAICGETTICGNTICGGE